MAVTQINGKHAKSVIRVMGIDWHLKKDATDPSTIFPFEKMIWMNAGCDQVRDSNIYCCWIMGVIPPTPGSLERPVSVFTLGFNQCQIPMSPASLTKQDMQRMHYYTSDYGDFTKKFIDNFLDFTVPEEVANRPSMMAFPEEQIIVPDQMRQKQTQVIQSNQSQMMNQQRIVDLS